MIADRILAERRLYRMATFARLAKIASPVNNPAPEILDALNTLLRRYPSGAQLGELRQHFDPRPDDCTLNRWLTHMIDQGRVVRSGSGPTTRYALAPAVAIVAPLDPTPAGAAAPPRLCQSLAQILRRSLSPPLLQPRCRAVFRPPLSDSLPPAVPTFAEPYAQCAPPLIPSATARVAATAALQQQAAFLRLSPGDAKAFVTFAVERLDTLTPVAAEAFELTRTQYDVWRQHYLPPAVTSRLHLLPRLLPPRYRPLATAAPVRASARRPRLQGLPWTRSSRC